VLALRVLLPDQVRTWSLGVRLPRIGVRAVGGTLADGNRLP